ncbi:hypothetical protein BC777_3040 [Yoonia maricola]|uniref:Uncharacterized protein n=1 Tax=Yoonia maricola TaxID=420999 RepID=A0A2M8W298_9RHOB|nr:hypothetical protein BC777_3040 [Yoonia maricola]
MRFGTWRGIAGSTVIILIVFILFVRVPTQTSFKQGKVTGVTAHTTEYGTRQHIGVIFDGQNQSAVARGQLHRPATDDIVCLRETTYWPFDQTRLSLVANHFCE